MSLTPLFLPKPSGNMVGTGNRTRGLLQPAQMTRLIMTRIAVWHVRGKSKAQNWHKTGTILFRLFSAIAAKPSGVAFALCELQQPFDAFQMLSRGFPWLNLVSA